MTNTYKDIEVSTHERVVYCQNDEANLKAWIAIHNTKRGPALGGCRMWNYDTEDEALFDVLRLSEGMTYKAALSHLSLGGGKAVIWGDPKTDKTDALFEAMGKFINTFDGTYISGEDVGTRLEDIQVMARVTDHVGSLKGSGDPSPMTAYGVLKGIEATVKYKLGRKYLQGTTVAIQGIGAVGRHLAHLLFIEGCKIYAADINEDNLRTVVRRCDVTVVPHDEIHTVDCDVFAPCALGGIINDKTIPELNCSIVAGSANNQLLESKHGVMLHRNHILYAPDYIINAGGLANIYCEVEGIYSEERARELTLKIAKSLINIYETAAISGRPTNVVADMMARDIINA